MFGLFGKRRRFNGDVSALLPAFQFNLKDAGEIKTLDTLDIAWRKDYSTYEAALFVAYLVYSGMLKKDNKRASEILKRINYVQAEWIQLGIVSAALADGFSAKAAEWLIKSKLHQDIDSKRESIKHHDHSSPNKTASNPGLNLTGNMPDITSTEPYERYNNPDHFILFSENAPAIAEKTLGVSVGINYSLVATAVNIKTGLPDIFVTLEKSASGEIFICYFDKNGTHTNLGNGKDFQSKNKFRQKAGEIIHEKLHTPIYF